MGTVLSFAALGTGTGYVAGKLTGRAIEATMETAEPYNVQRYTALGGASAGIVQGTILGHVVATNKCTTRS